MDAERQRSSLSSPVATAAAMSKVLDDDNMLGEILIRLAFPTRLIRAALVCRRCLRMASDPAFLCRFRNLHPPCVLGFYVETECLGFPKFVQIPHLPTELASVIRLIRRASLALDTYSVGVTAIVDCRNGCLVRFYSPNRREIMLSPLHPERDTVILPPPPLTSLYHHAMCINNGGVAVVASWQYRWQPERTVVHVHELQDGAWHNLTSPTVELPLMRAFHVLLTNGKAYMFSSASTIVALHSASEYNYYGSSMMSFADDSGVHLIHIEELQISVWLHRTDNWLLVDNISLREVCDKSGVQTLSSQDGLNATFKVLASSDDVLYIQFESTVVDKVYTVTPEDRHLIKLAPFMMIWPPVFPNIKDVRGQKE